MRTSPKASLSSRLWPRVDTSGGPEACWPWTGARNADGYGVLRFQGKLIYAHRAAFALAHGGVIPAGHFVLHACDNPPCCNAAHLSNGTVAENTKQAYARGLEKPHLEAANGARRKKKGKAFGGDPLELRA